MGVQMTIISKEPPNLYGRKFNACTIELGYVKMQSDMHDTSKCLFKQQVNILVL